jgi:predicted nucleic acid-binding protein
VLGWLLGEPREASVRRELARADAITASELTLVECDRALVRRQAAGSLAADVGARLRRQLAATAAHWNIVPIAREVVERARRPFPGEPIRTLDALHLASALVVRAAVSDFALLSLDGRVRVAGRALGFEVLPT